MYNTPLKDDYMTLTDVYFIFRRNFLKIFLFSFIGLLIGIGISYSTKKYYKTESIIDYPVRSIDREDFKKSFSESLMLLMNDRKSAGILAGQLTDILLKNNEKEIISTIANEIGTKISHINFNKESLKEFENYLTNYFYTYNYKNASSSKSFSWIEKFNIQISPSIGAFDTNIIFSVNFPQKNMGRSFISYLFEALNETALILKSEKSEENSYAYYKQNSPMTAAIISINAQVTPDASDFRKVVDLISRYHEIIKALGMSNENLFDEFTRSYQASGTTSTYSDEAYLDYLDGKIADRIAVKKISITDESLVDSYYREAQKLFLEKKSLFTLNRLKENALEETSKIAAINYAEFASKMRNLPHFPREEISSITPVNIKSDARIGTSIFVLPLSVIFGTILGIGYAFLSSLFRKNEHNE